MDAVNPDYLTVKILNRHHEPIVAWVLEGNYLLGDRVPVLIALYHGSLTFWFGLPLFALFGTTVEGLRLTHALFGLGVLASLYGLLLCAGLRPWQATVTCIALAIDPAFSYAFRTQSYITLAADAGLLLSVTFLVTAQRAPVLARACTHYFFSGYFLGVATFGYFIFAFYLPVLLIAVAWARPASARYVGWRPLAFCLAGLTVGASGYVLGYALVLRKAGSLSELWAFFAEQQSTLGAFQSQLALADRLGFAWSMVDATVSNAWHHAMIFGELVPVPASNLKMTLLVFLPYALWLLAEWRGRANIIHRLMVSLPVSFFAVSLAFGDRLGGHHFITLVPILYAALALGLRSLSVSNVKLPLALPVASYLIVATIGGVNIAGQLAEGNKLDETGGVGLMSDAINRLAIDLEAMPNKPFVVFPDWGLALPVAFLTRGSVGMTSVDDPVVVRRTLCTGRDVAVALIEGDRTARRNDWTKRLHWSEPEIKDYRQRDGVLVFDIVTYRGDRAREDCLDSKPLEKPP